MSLPSSPEDFANQAARFLPLSGLIFLLSTSSKKSNHRPIRSKNLN
jgi:hypothetical protein